MQLFKYYFIYMLINLYTANFEHFLLYKKRADLQAKSIIRIYFLYSKNEASKVEVCASLSLVLF